MEMTGTTEKIEAMKPVEVQIAPLGAFTQFVDDSERPGERKMVTQILDEEAAKRIVSAMREDVLVDFDHGSEREQSTEAAAWIKALRIDPDRGVVADVEFTPAGAEAVSQRRYRFVSPAWTLDGEGRPERLVSVALTNKPNLPVAPVLNMRVTNAKADRAGAGVLRADNKASGGDTEKEERKCMEKVKEILGLPAEASEEDVMAAIDALKAKVADMTAAQNEAEAAEFAEKNKDVVENVEELKEQYLDNPEATKKVVENCRRMMERVALNHKAAIAKASAVRAVVNSRMAESPDIAVNPVTAGLAKCATPEERTKYIMAHRAEM